MYSFSGYKLSNNELLVLYSENRQAKAFCPIWTRVHNVKSKLDDFTYACFCCQFLHPAKAKYHLEENSTQCRSRYQEEELNEQLVELVLC